MKNYKKAGTWQNVKNGIALIEKDGRTFALCGYSPSNDYFRRCWEVADAFTAIDPCKLFIADIVRKKNDFVSNITDFVISERID